MQGLLTTGVHKTTGRAFRLLCAYQFLVPACCAFRTANSPGEGVRSSDSSPVIDGDHTPCCHSW